MYDLMEFLNSNNPTENTKPILNCLNESKHSKETKIESLETQIKCLEKISELSNLDAADILALSSLTNHILKKLNITVACRIKQNIEPLNDATPKAIIQRCYAGTINILNVVFRSGCLENFEVHLILP